MADVTRCESYAMHLAMSEKGNILINSNFARFQQLKTVLANDNEEVDVEWKCMIR